MRRWKRGKRFTLLAALSHVVSLWFLPVVSGAIVTVNVDNANGDENTGAIPTYGGTWTSVSATRPCLSRFCPLQPNVSNAFDGTYNYGVSTSNFDDAVTVTINFTGISVKVFFITFTGSDFETFAHFTLDGVDRTSFLNGKRAPLASPVNAKFQFDRVVFDLEGLSNTEHTLVIGSKASINFTSVLLFDRMQYQFDDTQPTTTSPGASNPQRTSTTTSAPQVTQTVLTTATVDPTTTMGSDNGGTLATSPQSNSSSNVGKIVGGVIGGVAALALIAAIAMLNFVCYNRRRRRKDHFGPYTRRDTVLADESSIVEEQGFQSSPFVLGSSALGRTTIGRSTLGRSVSEYQRRSMPIMAMLKERPLSYAPSISSRSHGRRSSQGHSQGHGHMGRYSYPNPYSEGNGNLGGGGGGGYNGQSYSSSSILLLNNGGAPLPSIPQEEPDSPPAALSRSYSKRISPGGSEESVSTITQGVGRRVSNASSAAEIANIRAQIHRLEVQLDQIADATATTVPPVPAAEIEHMPPAYPGRLGLHLVRFPAQQKEPIRSPPPSNAPSIATVTGGEGGRNTPP